MASNTDASTGSAREKDAPEGSNFVVNLIRIVAPLVLIFLLVKPYVMKPKAAPLASQTFKARGLTMGTSWNAAIVANLSDVIELNNKGIVDSSDEEDELKSCEDLLARIVQRELDKIDALASTYRSDSEISRFNAFESDEWFPVSEETAECVAIALDVAEKTGGAFDPTVAPLVNLYRFGPNKSPLLALPTDEELDALRAVVGWKNLEVRKAPDPALRKRVPKLTLDLSGVAKGYAVDRVGKALEACGLNDYMIEVGGEIRVKGKKFDAYEEKSRPWTLGVETPEVRENGDEARRVPNLYRSLTFGENANGAALATSGDYRNYLQVGDLRISHIIDPRSGKPTEIVREDDANAERLGAVSVVSLDLGTLSCAEVDAFATAFFVLGEKDALALADKLGVPLLMLFRADDSASKTREATSAAFQTQVDSTLMIDGDGAPSAR